MYYLIWIETRRTVAARGHIRLRADAAGIRSLGDLETYAPRKAILNKAVRWQAISAWTLSHEPPIYEDPTGVVHNPTPSML